MDLETPGADIAGFEYEAKTAKDRAKLDAAIAEPGLVHKSADDRISP